MVGLVRQGRWAAAPSLGTRLTQVAPGPQAAGDYVTEVGFPFSGQDRLGTDRGFAAGRAGSGSGSGPHPSGPVSDSASLGARGGRTPDPEDRPKASGSLSTDSSSLQQPPSGEEVEDPEACFCRQRWRPLA